MDGTVAGGRGVRVTIYQLLDDSTRYDVGTAAFADPENGDDAVSAVRAALAAYGVPQELLSDNGGAFNLARQGSVTQLQRLLADHGCRGITGSFRSPTTQGKDERSHQTLTRFLDAYRPTSLEQVCELLVAYREYYNHRRHHQSLYARASAIRSVCGIGTHIAAELRHRRGARIARVESNDLAAHRRGK